MTLDSLARPNKLLSRRGLSFIKRCQYRMVDSRENNEYLEVQHGVPHYTMRNQR